MCSTDVSIVIAIFFKAINMIHVGSLRKLMITHLLIIEQSKS